jgi:ribonuclease P protein component
VVEKLPRHVAGKDEQRSQLKNNMLSKKKRVTKELFPVILKKGGTLSTSLFSFRYIPSEIPRYAFVAPKTVAKKAVDRNKLRRQGYAALRLYNLKPCSGVFFYKKQAKAPLFQSIKEDVGSILSKIRL